MLPIQHCAGWSTKRRGGGAGPAQAPSTTADAVRGPTPATIAVSHHPKRSSAWTAATPSPST